MIGNEKLLAIIPARGGSKRIPRKNIKPLAGKPLIAWTIEEAKKSRYIDQLILSSEDSEIIKTAKDYGCSVPFTRPAELSRDETPGIAPVLHALEMLPGYSWVILLQPTSPLRTVQDIDGCIEQCLKARSPICVSVTEVEKNPAWMFYIGTDKKLNPVIRHSMIERSQDLPIAYALNGAIYLARVDFLLKNREFITQETSAYIMPKERSIDVDTEIDFKTAEVLVAERK